jgi:uncharacterized membrane protein YhiD involved in acid resistance
MPIENQDHEHGALEHMDAAATLPEREPVRVYGTMPTTILATAGAIVAFGAGSPLTALGCAIVIVSVSAILELVRARVSPPATDSLDVPTSHVSRDHDATRRRRARTRRRDPRHARKTGRAPSVS